jgi:hypothetical protein
MGIDEERRRQEEAEARFRQARREWQATADKFVRAVFERVDDSIQKSSARGRYDTYLRHSGERYGALAVGLVTPRAKEQRCAIEFEVTCDHSQFSVRTAYASRGYLDEVVYGRENLDREWDRLVDTTVRAAEAAIAHHLRENPQPASSGCALLLPFALVPAAAFLIRFIN